MWVRSQKFVVDHLVSFVKIRDGMMIPLLGAEFPKRGIEDTCKKGKCVHTGMHTLAPRLSCWRTDQHPSAKMNGFPAQGMKTVQKKAEKWAEYTTRELQKEDRPVAPLGHLPGSEAGTFASGALLSNYIGKEYSKNECLVPHAP